MKDIAEQLKSCPKDKEFWELLCQACYSGKGKEFFNLMRSFGVIDQLFPLLDGKPKNSSTMLDFIATQFAAFDAEYKSYEPIDKRAKVYAMFIGKELQDAF